MTSLVEGERAPAGSGAEGSMSLDPGNFVDTSGWAGELACRPQQPREAQRPHERAAARTSRRGA